MTKTLQGISLIVSLLLFHAACSDEGGEGGQTDSGAVTDTAEDTGAEATVTDTEEDTTTVDVGDTTAEDVPDEAVEEVSEVTEEPIDDVAADEDAGETEDTDVMTTDITDADQDIFVGFDVTSGDAIDSGPPPACDTTVVADICAIICAVTDVCFSSGVEACTEGCNSNISDCSTTELESICTCISNHLTCAAFDTWNDCMEGVACAVP